MIISVLMLSEKIYFSSILLRFSFPSERSINNIKERQTYHLTPFSVKRQETSRNKCKKIIMFEIRCGVLGTDLPLAAILCKESETLGYNCESIFLVWSVQNITVTGDRNIHIIMLANEKLMN